MPRIALSSTFLRVHGRLDTTVRKKVDALCGKLRDGAHANGVHLEPYSNASDPRARTARVDRNWRAILADVGDDTLVLFTVLKHDDADRWMMNNRFEVNPRSGAFDLIDVEAISKVLSISDEDDDAAAAPGPLAHRSEKDLRQLGVTDGNVARVLLRARSEAEVSAIAALLPPDQGEAIDLLLHPTDSVEDIYATLESELEIAAGEIDTEDLAAAVARTSSASEYVLVDGAAELEDVLSREFAEWEVFLHPRQRAVAYREQFNGPARITGGPGTGKTVALLHRAVFLANRLGTDDPPILLTTYTRRLASDLRRLLVQLGGTDVLERVEVRNIDKVAFTEYQRIGGEAFRALGEAEQDEWQRAAESVGGLSHEFLRDEFEHVVSAQNLQTGPEYLRAARRGRGRSLDRSARIRVWRAMEQFRANTIDRNRPNFLQMAQAVATHHTDQVRGVYAHILVDEAQDIAPAQWRMLRALVPSGPNDLFIAGDAHQRIYDRYVTLRSVGIDIVGRSHRLNVNYRTTNEILRWSLGVLGGLQFDDLDGGVDTLRGYRSEILGNPPHVVGHTDEASENAAMAKVVAGWLDDGIAPTEIGICTRSRRRARSVFAALRNAGIPAGQMDAEHDGIRVGTMHLAKGLEFRFVMLVGVSDGIIPWAPELHDPSTDDPLSAERALLRERSLLYVAASRAREHLEISWAGRPSTLLPIEALPS